jgi:GNAT superfamily N-acetyltransferase
VAHDEGEAQPVPAGVLHIRLACAEDASALLALLSQLHDETEPTEPTEALRDTLGRILATRGRVLLIAELEGTAVGTLDLLVVENLTRGARPWAAIENFVVDRAHRRLGVGRALLDAAVEIASNAGCFKLQLVSHGSRTAAHAVYERAGFDAPARGFRRYL